MVRRILSASSICLLPFFGALVACGSDADQGAPPPPPAAEPPIDDSNLNNDTPTPEEPPICAEASGTYSVTKVPSNVLFLLDRSGSMHIELPNKATRWDSMEKGVFDLLGVLPSSTQAGVMMFPQGDQPVNQYCGIDASINDVTCKDGWPEPGQAARCDTKTYKVGVPSAQLTTAQVKAIENEVKASDAGFYWGTPSSTAINAAVDAQRASTAPGAKSIILFTDGNPTSCGDVGISNDVSNVVNAAARGLDTKQGALVRTFVIGLVDGARQAAKAENLSPVATAGGTARYPGCDATNDCFYAVDQSTFAADLKKIFDEISLQAFDCTFDLPKETANTDPNQINVQITSPAMNGSVPHDKNHQNGWDYLPNGTQIQLYGQACTDMKDDKAKLKVVLGCKTEEKPSAPPTK